MTVLLFLLALVGITALMRLPVTERSAGALVQTLVEASAAYFIVYCLVANVLVLFSAYRGAIAIYVATLTALVVTLIAAHRGRLVPWPQLLLSRADAFVLLFLLIMGPAVIQRYEFLVVQGDAGVYSVSAIHLATRGQLVDTLPVRDQLSADLRRIYDRDNLLGYDPSTRQGYYLPGTYLIGGSRTTYYYQFYPTWPLLLAGWGAVFGLAKMHFVLAFLYGQCVLLFHFILRALRPPRLVHSAGLILFGSSPLLVHFSKYPTSEVFLLMLFLLTVHLLLTGDAAAAILAGLAVTVFSLTHISAFMYMPVLFVLLVGALGRERRPLGVFLVVAFLGWASSVPYGYHVSQRYLRDIFASVFSLLRLTLAETIALLLLAGVASAVIAAYTVTRGSRAPGDSAISPRIGRPNCQRLMGVAIRLWLIALIARTAYNAYLLGWSAALIPRDWSEWNSWSARGAYVNRGFVSLLHLNCVSVAMATGLVILPVTLIALFLKPETVCRDMRAFVVTLTLLLALSIYTFAGIDTTNNYYASRYFLPILVPSLLLTFALVAGQQFRSALVVFLVAPGLLFNMRHDIALYLKPAFQGNFTLIEGLLQTIPRRSVVFLDARPFSRRLLTQPLRYLGDATPISIANDQPLSAVERRRMMQRYAEELNISDAYVISESPPENGTCSTFRLEHEEQPWMILYPTTMHHSTFVYHVCSVHFWPDRL